MGKHYDYIYSIVCFSGFHNPDHDKKRSRVDRLKQDISNHLLFLQHYHYAQNKKICVLLAQRGEDTEVYNMLRELIDKHQSPHLDYHILIHPNWGMTVGTLWDCWKWCQENGITSDYWWTLDDDYICNHWQQREHLLNNEGFLMVGQWEICSFGDWNRDYYIKCWELGYKIPSGHADDGVLATLKVLGAKPEDRCWSDGGFYMFRYDGLKKLEDKVGCFMKCPNGPSGLRQEITMDNGGYYDHGITWGEVGFPTLIKGAGFKFCCFSGGSYLCDRWDRVDISQSTASGLSPQWDNPEKNGFYHDKPDHRSAWCKVKLPFRQNIRSLLLANKHLEPPNFPYREDIDPRYQ